eukprot:jgi/Ulvmu1/1587/UM111_0015.1
MVAMLRAATISDSPKSTPTSTSHGTQHSAQPCDADLQFCMGFRMSPRMFAESFGLKKWQPKSYAACGDDGDVTSDDLRLYHYRQFMTKERPDLPVKLKDSVQLDCQHRPVLVRFVANDIYPIDAAEDAVTEDNASRMASMSEALARAALRQNSSFPAPPAPDNTSLVVTPEADTVIIQTNLGNFRRQQGKLVVKAFVRPEAFAHVLREHGREDEAAIAFADDPAWVYKARWMTSLPFMFAHQSISRVNTNANSVVLRGDIQRHGFCPGPTLTFQRGGQPAQAQIYISTVFPYFFVSTSLQSQPHPQRNALALDDTAAARAQPDDEPAASGNAPDGTVSLACFDADDLLHVMHAVVKKLAERNSRGADEIASATKRSASDDVGLEINIVPVPLDKPQKVFDAVTDGFPADELETAAQQQPTDLRQHRALQGRKRAFAGWKVEHVDSNGVVKHENIPLPGDVSMRYGYRGGHGVADLGFRQLSAS